jgi:hypothetical protein
MGVWFVAGEEIPRVARTHPPSSACCRGVAQLGRALRSGRRGHRFKSCRPDHVPESFRQGVLLFSRFSPASKRVLRAAEQECRSRNHYYIGVEHMLMALLEEHDPLIEARLAELGIGADEAYAELRRTLGTGEDHLWDGILVTPRMRIIVELAEEIAGDDVLEPVHLFSGIIDEGAGAAAELLRRLALVHAKESSNNTGTGQRV